MKKKVVKKTVLKEKELTKVVGGKKHQFLVMWVEDYGKT